jgi:hypothetical protein
MVYRLYQQRIPRWGAREPIFEAGGYSNAKMRFQSFFMLTTIQPSLVASS